jgi:hypothetical protein
MKKVLPLFFFLLCGCTAQRSVVDNESLLKNHPQPYTVFAIGQWKEGYAVVTLIDSHQQYFTITTTKKDGMKVGDIYTP